jgi:hypothetical protein
VLSVTGADQCGGGHRTERAQRHPDLHGRHDERQRGRLQQPEGQGRPGAVGAQAEQRGQAAHGQQREQEQRDPGQRGRAVQQPGQVEPDPAADEEHRHQEPIADRVELGAEVRVRRGAAVHQADDGPGQEGAQDGFQAEPLGQHGERHQQQDGR